MSKYKGPFLYFPTVAAPITVSYNLSGVKNLQLSPETLAKIFQGEITKWNDAAITADNPKADAAVHRDHRGRTGPTARAPRRTSPKYLVKARRHRRGRSAPTRSSTGRPVSRRATATPVSRRSSRTPTARSATSTSRTPRRPGWSSRRSRTPAASTWPRRSTAPPRPSRAPRSTRTSRYDPLNATGADAYPITAPTYILVYTTQTRRQRRARAQGLHELHLRRRPGPGRHRGLRPAACRHPVARRRPRSPRSAPRSVTRAGAGGGRPARATHRPSSCAMTVAIEPRPLSTSVRAARAGRSTAPSGCVAFVAGALVLVILALIAVTMIVEGWPAFQRRGPLVLHQRRLGPASRGRSARWRSRSAPSSSSVIARGHRGAGEHRHRALHHRGRAAVAAHADHLRDRPARRGAVGRLRPLGRAGARPGAARLLPGLHDVVRRRPGAQHPLLRRPDLGPVVHDRRAHPRDHDHADRHLGRARDVRDGPAVAEGRRARARRDPLGDDPGRGVPAQPQRPGRRRSSSASAARSARRSPSRWSSARARRSPPSSSVRRRARRGHRRTSSASRRGSATSPPSSAWASCCSCSPSSSG